MELHVKAANRGDLYFLKNRYFFIEENSKPFDSSLTLLGTDREVKVLSLGTVHTKCDSILLLPEEKIVFSGDVVSIDNHPMLSDGDPDNWVKVLDDMGQMDITTIVPGHGPVGNRLVLQQIQEYIEEPTNISFFLPVKGIQ